VCKRRRRTQLGWRSRAMPPRPHAQSQGTLYRAGPGRIRVGKHLYGHWFDGDGAVRQRRDVCALRCGDC
jgi:hypothetical protein